MTKLDSLALMEKKASSLGARFAIPKPWHEGIEVLQRALEVKHPRHHPWYGPKEYEEYEENKDIEKSAAPRWLRNAGTALGAGTGILFGAQMGSELGKDVASLAHKGPIGLGSEARWKHGHQKKLKSLVNPRALKKAKKKETLAGGLGLAAGALATLPFSKKPLLMLGGALAGRSLGRYAAKKNNPILASLDMDPTDSSMGETSGLLSAKQKKAWHALLTSPSVASDPAFKKRLVDYYNEVAQARPEYKEYEEKKSRGKLLGGILGASAMAAALLLAKRSPGSSYKKIVDYAAKKKIPVHAAQKALAPSKFQRAIGGRTYWPWAGLTAGALGLGAAKTLEGGRRAGINPKDTNRRAREEAMSQAGLSLLFYGGGPK